MILPNNGKVVIIDDVPNDVTNLANALTREKMPFLFYKDLEMEDLPLTPVNNVRLLFLDLDLGLGGISPKEKIRIVQERLYRILEPKTPYILVIWSTHEDRYAETLQEEFQSDFRDYKPLATCSLDKTEIQQLEKDGKTDVIQLIRTKLTEQLSGFSSFNIFLLWESIINDTCGEAVNELINSVNNLDEWEKSLKMILKKLAHAYLGNRIKTADSALTQKSAMMTFNELFRENLEKSILQSLPIDNIDFGDITQGDKTIIARLNSKLLFESNPQNDRSPGNVYQLSDLIKTQTSEQIKTSTKVSWLDSIVNRRGYLDILSTENEEKIETDKLSKNAIKAEASMQIDMIANEAILVDVEVSPTCDFAQEKRVFSRHVRGCLFPIDTPLMNFIKTGTDYLYISPLIDYKGSIYKLILDFRLFSSSEIDLAADSQPIFKIRHQLLSDIQINAAKHISRTGVTFIDERDY